MKSLIPAAVVVATLTLAACQGREPATSADEASIAVDPPPPGATTGAGGAATAPGDPNPAGAGATTGADPDTPSAEMDATAPTAVNPPAAMPEPPLK